MFRSLFSLNKWNSVIKSPYCKKLRHDHSSLYTQSLCRLLDNPMIKESLTEVSKARLCEFTIDHRIAFGRSLEIFNLFKNSHYVFHHGQSGKVFLPFNLLIKNIIDPTLSSHETFVRHPIQLQNINKDVKFYTDNIVQGNMLQHNDNIYTKELLSVDGHLSSTAMGESAFRHFIARGNSGTNVRDK